MQWFCRLVRIHYRVHAGSPAWATARQRFASFVSKVLNTFQPKLQPRYSSICKGSEAWFAWLEQCYLATVSSRMNLPPVEQRTKVSRCDVDASLLAVRSLPVHCLKNLEGEMLHERKAKLLSCLCNVATWMVPSDTSSTLATQY